ncbi:TIGR03943 family protein [Pauljensenia sp. 27098_8_83]
MRVMDRLAPVAESLSLACLGAGLLWLSLSGRYASFVPPSARLGIIASGVCLLACSLALSARLGSADHEHTDSAHTRRALSRALVALLASALIVLPFRVSPSELASTAWNARVADAGTSPGLDAGDDGDGSASTSTSQGEASPTVTPQSGDAASASSSGKLELTTDNFYDQVEELIAHGRAHDGDHIDLVGFVMSPEAARAQASIPRVTEDDSFAVARMAIWCCAADAYPIGFVVRWSGPAPEADSWVHVSGTLRLRGTKALVIDADSVEVTDAPNPEFVIQSR